MVLRASVVLLLSVTALTRHGSQGQALATPPNFSFSCATFPSDVSAASLEARFGRANVATAPVPFGGAEGDLNEGTVLFAGTADAEVKIFWRDRVGKRLPEVVSVSGARSRWQTPSGITLGTPLTAIENLNQRPFQLLGFGTDVDGTVMSWSGGQLEKQDQRDCRMRIRLGLGARDIPTDKIKQVEGEREFSSSHPAMQALNPTVRELFLQYVRGR
jgi:hypothetical protein